MPRLLEADAEFLTLNYDTLAPDKQAEAKDWLQRYKQQQADEGEPLFPAEVTRQVEQENNLRRMFEAPDKIDYDPGYTSADPLHDKMQHANMMFLASRDQKEPAEVASRYDFLLNDYARRKLGASEDVDTAKFYALAQKDMQKVKLREDTQREGMSAALRGEDGVKALSAWQAKNADRAKDDAGLFMRGYQQALEQDGEMLPIADRLLPLLEAVASKKEGQVFDQTKAQELGNMIEQLAGMKKAQRKSVYRSIAARIEAAGYDQKGFWSQMLGELDKGLYRMEGTLGTSAGIASDVATAVAGAQTRIPDTFDGSSVSMPVLSDEEQQALLRQRDYRERIGNVQQEIMQIVSGELDPVKPVTGWMNETVETGLIKGPGAVAPFMASSALLGPYGAGLVFTADFAEQNRRELVQSGLDADQARKVGAMAAPLQAAVESLSNMVQLGGFTKLQTVLAGFTKPIGGGAGLAVRYVQNAVISLATEFTEEQLQDNFIVPAVQEIVGALAEDVPEVDWSFFKTRAAESTPELLSALAPMALVFGGAMTNTQVNLSRDMTGNIDALKALNYSEAQAVEVVSEKTEDARIAKARSLWASRAGDKVTLESGAKNLAERMRQLSGDAMAQQRELERRGKLPILRPLGDGLGRILKWLMTIPSDGSAATFDSHQEADKARWTWTEDQLGKVHALTRETLASMEKNLDVGREVAVEFFPDIRTAQDAVNEGASVEQIKNRVEQGKTLGDISPDTSFEDAQAIDKATTEADGFLSSLRILGSSKNEFKDGILRTTIKLWEGANILTLVEEKLEGDAKAIIMEPKGREWMLSRLRNYEQASGDKLFRELPDEQLKNEDLVEGWSHLGQSYLVGRSTFGEPLQKKAMRRFGRLLMRSGLTGAMNAESSFFAAVASRAQKLSELKQAGKLSDDLVSELEKQLGIDSQVAHDAAATKEADAIASEAVDTSGYSPETPGPNGETFSVQQLAADFEQKGKFYRVIHGEAAFQDVVESGFVRTNASAKVDLGSSLMERLKARPTAFPSFSKDHAAMSYAQSNPNHFIIVTDDSSLQPSKSGRHSKGKTYFPTNEQGEHLSSLPADKVDIFRHVGDGIYQLAFTRGKVTSEENPGPNGETFSTRAVPADASKIVQMPDGAQFVGPTTFSIRAYHGTPHKVDRFRTDKIGTGEGAQAYGWGLYFAENRGIGEYYQRALTDNTLYFKGRPLLKNGIMVGSLGDVELDDWFYHGSESFDPEESAQSAEADGRPDIAAKIRSLIPDITKGEPGNLYTVELLPDESEFLDWDKPLSEQSDKVDQVNRVMREITGQDEYFQGVPADMPGSWLYHRFAKSLAQHQGTTEDFSSRATLNEARAASEALARAGIPGIKYLDGNSRNDGDGTRNYVIFDENLVRILEENGKPVETFSMASTSGAAQNAEPSPGGLSEAVVNVWGRSLPIKGETYEVVPWDDVPNSPFKDFLQKNGLPVIRAAGSVWKIPTYEAGDILFGPHTEGNRESAQRYPLLGAWRDLSELALVQDQEKLAKLMKYAGYSWDGDLARQRWQSARPHITQGKVWAGLNVKGYVPSRWEQGDSTYLYIYGGKIAKDEIEPPHVVKTLWLKKTEFPDEGITYSGHSSSGVSGSFYPRIAFELSNGVVVSERIRISDHGQVSDRAPRRYSIDLRVFGEDLHRKAFRKIITENEPRVWDGINDLVAEEWEEQKSQSRPLTGNAGETFSMASTSGAAQNAEPSPGGLSEAEVPILFGEDNRLTNLNPQGASWSRIKSENPGVQPGQSTVSVYRATIGKTIRRGDFVALNPKIAREHLQALKERGDKGARVITQEVALKDLLMANDATEFVFAPESSRAATDTFSLRPGDFAARMEAKFSLFQAKPELRLAIAQVAKERALRLGAEWIAKGDVIRSAKDIGKEARMREALAYEARMNEYLDGLSENARQTLEFEPSALEDDPLVAAMLDFGKLMSFTTAKKSGKVEAKSGDYDGQPWLPPAWFSKGAGIMPDQMAQAMFDAGMLPDAYTGTLWSELEKRIEATRKDKAAHREAVQAYKAAEKYARDASRAEADQWAENAKKQAGSPKAQRDMLKAALRTLDGILAAAPPEVRARVGGYVKLAGLATDEAMLQEIERRIDKLNVELEKYLKKEYRQQIAKFFKKYAPKKDDKGRITSNITADAAEDIGFAFDFASLDDANQEKEMAALEKTLEESEDSTEIQDAIGKIAIVQLFYKLEERESSELEAAAMWLKDVGGGAREARKIIDAARAEAVKEAKNEAKKDASNGKLSSLPDAENVEADVRSSTFKRFTNDVKGFLNSALFTFGQQLEIVFGQDSKITTEFHRRAVRAANDSTDIKRDIEARRAEFVAKLFGTKSRIQQAGRMGALTVPTASGVMIEAGGKTTTIDVPAEIVLRIIEGSANLKALGFTNKEASTLADAWADNEALPAKRQKRIFKIERRSDGKNTELTMSQDEAIQYFLWSNQKASREQMERDGWSKESFQQLNAFLSDDAKALAGFFADEYARLGRLIEPVYRRMFHAPFPRVTNYSPIFRDISSADSIIDINQQGHGSGVSSGFILARNKNARSAMRRTSAISAFMQHAESAAHWVSHVELVRDLRSVLIDKEVQNAIRSNGRTAAANGIKKRVMQLENQGKVGTAGIAELDSWGSRLIQARAFKGLSWRISPVIKQTSAYFNPLLADVPAWDYMRGTARLLRGKLEVSAMWKRPDIQRRIVMGFSAEAKIAMDRLGYTGSTLLAAMGKGMMPMSLVDAGWTTAGAAIAFDYYRRINLKSMDETLAENAALDQLEMMIAESAQPGDAVNRSLIEGIQNPWLKSLWMFAGEQRKTLAIEIMALRRLATGKSKNKVLDVQRAVVAHVVMATTTQLMAGVLSLLMGDDDDREREWSVEEWAAAIAAGPINGLFLLGDAIDYAGRRLFGLHAFEPSTAIGQAVKTVSSTPGNLDKVINGEPEEQRKAFLRLGEAVGQAAALVGPGNPFTAADVILGNPLKEAEKILSNAAD